MQKQKTSVKMKIFKIALLVVFVAIATILLVRLFPFMKGLSTTEGQIEFREQILKMGFKGALLLFGLQLAQIMLVVLPGEPLEVLAGMCYGSIGGMLFILVTAFISTVLIYFIVKKYNEVYLYNFFKKEKIQKIKKSKWYKNTKRTELLLTILFLIPGTPKDLFVYMGPLLNIKPARFIFIATIARIPSVISSTMVGDNILFGNYTGATVVYAITAIVTLLFIIIVKLFDKDKITDDAIDSVK